MSRGLKICHRAGLGRNECECAHALASHFAKRGKQLRYCNFCGCKRYRPKAGGLIARANVDGNVLVSIGE